MIPEHSASRQIREFAEDQGRYERWKRSDPVLTRSQEHDLFTRLRACPDTPDGRRESRRIADTIARHNTRLVMDIVTEYARKTTNRMTVAEMYSSGLLGLHNAIGKFDPARGFKFSTMATPWIRQAIRKDLHLARPIHIPLTQVDGRNNSGPDADQLAAHAERAKSFEHPDPGSDWHPLDDVASREPQPIEAAIQREKPELSGLMPEPLRYVLSRLCEQDRRILMLRASGLIFGEIADVMGKSRETCRQMHDRAFYRARSVAMGRDIERPNAGTTEEARARKRALDRIRKAERRRDAREMMKLAECRMI